jgi:hypothetical protein
MRPSLDHRFQTRLARISLENEKDNNPFAASTLDVMLLN